MGDDKLRVLPKLVEPRPIQRNDEDEEQPGLDLDGGDAGDAGAESEDDLQWKKLKQFPHSPMRDGQCEPDGQLLAGITSDEESDCDFAGTNLFEDSASDDAAKTSKV